MQSLGQSGGRVQWKKATIVQYMFQNIVAVSVKGKKDHGYTGAMVKNEGKDLEFSSY